MTDTLFAKEQIFEVPSCSLDGRIGARRVRVYVKGPSQGIGPSTRIIVNIHGIGGRQLDVSYKRLRRDVSEECDCVMIGVDFFGTQAMWIDPTYLHQEKERLVALIRQQLPGFNANKHINDKGEVFVDPDRAWYCNSAFSANQMTRFAPEDAWDYGLIQALDIVSALKTILPIWEKLALPLPTIHFFTRSAGSQIASLCAALHPKLIASIVHIAPLILSQNRKQLLQTLLTNPVGAAIGFGSDPITFVQRKAPVAFSAPLNGYPALDDHMAMRMLDNPSVWEGIKTKVQVMSWRGHDDGRMPRCDLESVNNRMEHAGATCHIVDVSPQMVDGVIFVNTQHDLIGDLKPVFNHVKAHLFSGDQKPQHPNEWSDRVIPSVNGRWRIAWNPSPHWVFEP